MTFQFLIPYNRLADFSSFNTLCVVGLIAGSYDIACLVVCVPMSYLGSRPGASKPRWLGFCIIIMGLGSFLFVLPHFLVGPYDARAGEADEDDSVTVACNNTVGCVNLGSMYCSLVYCNCVGEQ